ncbi:TadE/TadG family type IV pilus assembly protein [Arthrobacter sp. SLBN-112]|uniref:TadE/TadG family type IV pilus assembly protein n=1 Tax=Arthrobacter sp. SLBN-112 TaxID=2768452 RepID=UPI0035A9A975
MSSLVKRRLRPRAREAGAVAVEFALVLPLFLVLVLGIGRNGTGIQHPGLTQRSGTPSLPICRSPLCRRRLYANKRPSSRSSCCAICGTDSHQHRYRLYGHWYLRRWQ